MEKLNVAIVGGSGYTGGELLRLLFQHPQVTVKAVTSRAYKGKPLHRVHPNFRGITNLKFILPDELEVYDILFLALPHGTVAVNVDKYKAHCKTLIDLSSDFRLRNKDDYVQYYGHEHERPDLLSEFVYGMPELHRSELEGSDLIAVPGCTATGAILPLKPLVDAFKVKQVIIDAKVGSSASGAQANGATHHPERHGVVRSFKPSGHRHIAEMQQEINHGGNISVNFSPHAVELIRGIQSTIHIFLEDAVTEKEVWQAYLKAYKNEPFIRLVKEKSGIYRFPEPKVVMGTNICEIGFEIDRATGRLIVMSAIDNLMKGAAGQAVQCMNVSRNFDETLGLTQLGFHPV